MKLMVSRFIVIGLATVGAAAATWAQDEAHWGSPGQKCKSLADAERVLIKYGALPFDSEFYDTCRTGAEQGHAGAQGELGMMCYEGRGVARDYAQAVVWFRLAAEQGDPFAQVKLGIMYVLGRGMAQDNVTAHKWFNLAAAAGHRTAQRLRNELQIKMKPEQVVEAQRLAREWFKGH